MSENENTTPSAAENPPPVVTAKTETIAPDNLAAEITGSMPEATQEETSKPKEETFPRQEGDHFFDRAGTRFDPDLHRSNGLTGVPEINEEGNFKSKRGAKKKGEAYRPAAMPDGTAIPPDEYDHNARLFLGMFYAFSCANISPAWKPGGLPPRPGVTPEQHKAEADAEDESLRFPLAAYLREKRFRELKPWQMLTLAIASFGFRRYSEDETTKEKFQAISAKVRAQIFGAKPHN